MVRASDECVRQQGQGLLDRSSLSAPTVTSAACRIPWGNGLTSFTLYQRYAKDTACVRNGPSQLHHSGRRVRFNCCGCAGAQRNPTCGLFIWQLESYLLRTHQTEVSCRRQKLENTREKWAPYHSLGTLIMASIFPVVPTT